MSLRQKFKFWSINNRNHSILSPDHHYQNVISLLQSCGQTSQTSQVHASMIKIGLDTIPFPMSKLLAHVSVQDVNYATSIFSQIKTPNLYMFNTMLRGYSVSDDPQKGLVLFSWIRAQNYGQDFLLDQFTFVSVLKSCARLSKIGTGLAIHTVVVKFGFDLFLNVNNSLLHLYCVCGRIQEARQLFDEMCTRKDLVSWNTLMGGYLKLVEYDLVLDLFKELLHKGRFGITVITMLTVLSALREVRNTSLGECLHLLCVKTGFLSNLNIVSALISMYGKHSNVHAARKIFGETDVKKDVVLWNCLIDVYARSNLLEEALALLRLMKLNRVKPNSSTLAGLLSSCSASGSLSIGQYVHDYYVEEQKLDLDVVLGTAIIDMYAKSGLLGKAISVFGTMENKDVRSWTAMISGYGLHGEAVSAIKMFRQMEEEGFEPNEVTFLAVLNSCSHGGLIEEGMGFLKRMVKVYKLVPKIEHYGCVIDLMGRAGLLEEAYEMIKNGLPVEGDATAWRALLGACRVYGNVSVAERVKQELERIDDEHPSDSLVLSSAYTVAGMVDCRSRAKYLVKLAKKEAGSSTITCVDNL